MTRAIITMLLVCAVTVAGAFAHGTLTGRWTPHGASSDLVLPEIPTAIAGWKGEDIKSSLDGDKVLRNLSRKYTHPQSGRSFTVSLTAGPAGLTAQHTPEYCYPGSGFEAIGQTQSMTAGAHEFRTAVYRKKAGDALRILWAWTPEGTWSAPKYPELKFFRGNLYKLYVVSWTTDQPPEQDIELQEFLAHLLTTLDQCLFSHANPAGPAQP